MIADALVRAVAEREIKRQATARHQTNRSLTQDFYCHATKSGEPTARRE